MESSSKCKPLSRRALFRCFKILGLPTYAKEAEVRRAYRTLILKEHPDKDGSTERFLDIQKSYDTLISKFQQDAEERKKAYEALSAQGYKKASSVPPNQAKKEQSDDSSVLELRQGEDNKEVVPSCDLKKLGDEARQSGDHHRAVLYYNSAAAYARLDNLIVYAELYWARGSSFSALSRWEEAEADGERCVSLRPLWSPGVLLKAVALENLQCWSAAAQQYRRLLSVGSFSPEDPAVQEAREGLSRAESKIVQGSALATLSGHQGAVRCISFLPHPPPSALEDFPEDNPANSQDGVGSTPSTPSTPSSERRVQWALTCSDDNTARVWEVPGGRLLCTLKGHEAPVVQASWCPDGSGVLATASMDATARIWALNKSQGCWGVSCLHVLAAHSAALTDVVFSPREEGGIMLATTSQDNNCRVWDVISGLLIHALPALHTNTINTGCFSPSGRCLVTASDDQTARVWDLAGDVEDPGECVHTLAWDSGAINGVCYSPCGRLIITVTHLPNPTTMFYRILVWSAVSGRICRWYDGHHGIIHSLSWHPNPGEEEGNVLVTGSQDGTLKVWDISGEPTGAGKYLMEIDAFKGKAIPRPGMTERLCTGSVLDCRHSPAFTALPSPGGEQQQVGEGEGGGGGGDKVATTTWDGRLRVFGSEDWDVIQDIQAHSAPVWSVAWSPCGTVIGTASNDGTAKLWLADKNAPPGTAANPEGTRESFQTETRSELIGRRSFGHVSAANDHIVESSEFKNVEEKERSQIKEEKEDKTNGNVSATVMTATDPQATIAVREETSQEIKSLAAITAALVEGGGGSGGAGGWGRKSRKCVEEERLDEEIETIDNQISELQAKQRELASRENTAENLTLKREFRKSFVEKMKPLREKRAEIQRRIRSLYQPMANLPESSSSQHHRKPNALADTPEEALLSTLRETRDHQVDRLKVGEVRGEARVREIDAHSSDILAAKTELLDLEQAMIELCRHKFQVTYSSSTADLMKQSFYEMFQLRMREMMSRESELASKLRLSAVITETLLKPDVALIIGIEREPSGEHPPSAINAETTSLPQSHSPIFGPVGPSPRSDLPLFNLNSPSQDAQHTEPNINTNNNPSLSRNVCLDSSRSNTPSLDAKIPNTETGQDAKFKGILPSAVYGPQPPTAEDASSFSANSFSKRTSGMEEGHAWSSSVSSIFAGPENLSTEECPVVEYGPKLQSFSSSASVPETLIQTSVERTGRPPTGIAPPGVMDSQLISCGVNYKRSNRTFGSQYPWGDPTNEIDNKEAELVHRKERLEQKKLAENAESHQRDTEKDDMERLKIMKDTGNLSKEEILLAVEEEMLMWQRRRLEIVNEYSSVEKKRFHKRFTSRMAELRDLKNHLTVFDGVEPIETAAAVAAFNGSQA